MLVACSRGVDAGNQQPPVSLEPVALAAAAEALEYRAAPLFTLDAERGELVLGDEDTGEIITYDLAGSERGRFGRKGFGPGEYQYPIGLLTRSDGARVVVDGMSNRITHFDRDGQLVGTIPVPGVPLHLLGWSDEGVLLVWTTASGDGPFVGRIDLATGDSRNVFNPIERSVDLARRAGTTGGAAFPNPWLAMALDQRGRVLVGNPNVYRIFAFDAAGQPAGEPFGRPDLSPELPSDDEVRERQGFSQRIAQMAGDVPPEATEMLEKMARQPKPFYEMRAYAADSAGRLWIATRRGDGTRTEIDLFDGERVFIGTVQVPDRVKRIAVSLPYLAVLVERRSGPYEGHEGVDLYRVRDATPE